MTEPAPPRRLYRSRTNRMLGGVAGGLAEYLQVDSALVRLAFAALVLAAGAGFLGYIIASAGTIFGRGANDRPPGPVI